MVDPSLEEQLKLVRRATPLWTLSRQQQVIWRVRGRQQRERRRWSLFAATAAALIALSLGGLALYRRAASEAPTLGGAGHAGPMEQWALRDGSTIVVETPSTVITKRRESAQEMSFELAAGIARFEVARRAERTFRVQAGVVSVEVIGTRFRLERRGVQTAVRVEHGQVRVAWPGGVRHLSAGESGVFPPDDAAIAKAEADNSAPVPRAAIAPARAVARPADSSGEARSPRSAPSQAMTAEALFAEADRARAQGRLGDAEALLAQIPRKFPGDPRAPLAAFTRGRLLLESLGQPAAAARAFAQVRVLASASSTLSEDALAREVDALRAAGNLGLARERAESYRKLYPNGLRLSHVLRSAGLTNDP